MSRTARRLRPRGDGNGTHNAVLSVNPTTGARTTVSGNTAPASLPAFGYPYGIAATNPACATRA
ncbi:hypothetical protein [Dactylosporangium sp. NPDC005555]|uniref:hypothetical protein n=1 Tax=Dactylosporangium sp. NPDC005555 TaxID=3154889 RepID=UPI0033B2B85F